jgi:acetyl-CoA carboxylase biotin carboxyl carrier protein
VAPQAFTGPALQPLPAAVFPAVSPAEDANVFIVRSPMVGTFYAAPAPDKPPYVQKGQEIGVDEVLCIIEAMKLMNEIKSETAGKVVEILVSNGEPVEFDQPLFKIQKG